MADILLAEDNSADVYLIREALQAYGVDCPIRLASDGQDVLRMISPAGSNDGDHNLGLIILDLNLPKHDGIEILQRLRENERLAHVPVVILTSSDSPRDRLIVTRLGAARYLRKPSKLDQFLGLGAIFKELLAQPGSKLEAHESSEIPERSS